jgi:hypothetical protein
VVVVVNYRKVFCKNCDTRKNSIVIEVVVNKVFMIMILGDWCADSTQDARFVARLQGMLT